MKGLHEQLKNKIDSDVVFYEWKNNNKYILDQFGRIYLKSTKERVFSEDIESFDGYTSSLIGMDRHQAILYKVEITKKI
jgi:hypothetical protein